MAIAKKRYETLKARSVRYANELRNGKSFGEELTPTQAAFRMGVLNERKKQSNVYNHRNRRSRKNEILPIVWKEL